VVNKKEEMLNRLYQLFVIADKATEAFDLSRSYSVAPIEEHLNQQGIEQLTFYASILDEIIAELRLLELQCDQRGF
jgi:hypothetical protein